MSFSRHRNFNTAMLGIAALLLTACVGLSYRQWQRYGRANSEAQRSRETTAAINSVLASLDDAETGQRGFLLTGEDRYLDPYNRALQALPNDLATLGKLLGGGQQGQQDFADLNTLSHRKLDELRQTIDLRRTQGLQPALALVLTDEGRRTMDSIRALAARMKLNQNAIDVHASAAGQAASSVALLVAVVGAVVLFFFFAVGLEPFASPDPAAWRRSWLTRYGAAVLAVVVITLIRAALTPLIGPTNFPFTMYFCAVIFAAWFGGFRPAILSVVLSLFAGAWFFAAPTRTLLVSGHDDQIAMLVLVLVGFGAGLLSRSQRSAIDRASRAENAERNERQRFETTLSSIGDAVIATDNQGRVTFANKVALSLLRRTLSEVAGKPLDEVFHIVNEYTRAAVESPVARVLREGSIVGLANHTILIAHDGSEVPIDDSAAPIAGAHGEIFGVVLVFRNIAEKRQAEDQLAQQSAELRQRAEVMEHAQLLVRDMDDRIGYWNRGAELLYGYTAAEALGQISHTLFKTQFPAPPEDIRVQLMNTGEWEGELIHLKRDGSRIIVASHWTLHRDADGQPRAILEVNSDITERKRIADELRRERERLGLALSAGKMGVFELHPARNEYWWSAEVYALFGLAPAEFQPTRDSIAALIHPADKERFMKYWDENVSARQPVNHEFRILAPDGKERWISCRATPQHAHAGQPVQHYTGIFVDVTQRKEAEQVLRRFERLSAAARLSASLAHEINNPLTAVTNLLFLVRDMPGVPPAVLEQLALVDQELERVAHAARQSLGFYRESARAEPINVVELIESVLKIFWPKIGDKKIRIVRGFHRCAPIYGVRGEIRQVLSNLIANAIEAVPKGGTISLGTQPVDAGAEQAVEIIVADDGHGIASENLNHIFEPFFTTKVGTGTGLGLWAAKEIVERHLGSIEVQPPAPSGNRGATFVVRLPAGPGTRALKPPLNPAQTTEHGPSPGATDTESA